MPLRRKPAQPSPLVAPVARDIEASLASGDPEQRWAAARAAADDVALDSSLANALESETDPRVREAMLTSLTRLGTPISVDAILTLLRSDDAHSRTAALDAMRLVGTVSTFLPQLLHDADVDVRILSCELARSLTAPEATTLMCGLLAREHDENVCAAALDVLGEVAGPEALVTLKSCAERFRSAPFLVFAIDTVVGRILALSPPTRD